MKFDAELIIEGHYVLLLMLHTTCTIYAYVGSTSSRRYCIYLLFHITVGNLAKEIDDLRKDLYEVKSMIKEALPRIVVKNNDGSDDVIDDDVAYWR